MKLVAVYWICKQKRIDSIMNTRFSSIVTVAAAFTAGLCAGLMMAPQSGASLRRRLSAEARSQLKHAEEKLAFVESQLDKLNGHVQTVGKDLGNKVKGVADEIIPDLSHQSETWSLTKDEMERELRNLSRR